jgi:arylsulfatase A-like enzyme
MMDWRRWWMGMVVAWLAGCALQAAVVPAEAAGTAAPPNVLVIFVDDLGYADLGCQGSKDVKTPRIDSLATDGVRCTAGYVSAPQCCPSRAGLLTGRYQNRFGFETNPAGDVMAGLPLTERTIADDLQAAGYATGIVGKWHLGTAPGMEPWQRGFAESLWHPNGGVLFPEKRSGQLSDMRRGRDPADVKGYSTDAFGAAAADFITRHGATRAADGKPWFLYLPFVAPHWPMEAKPEHMAEFAAEPDLHRRTFLAMMASLDENVGKVLDTLDATGQRDDTLVFFVSDNGGPTGRRRPQPDAPFQYGQNTSRNDPLRGTKGDLFEGGIRVPFLVRWPGVIPAGTTYDEPVISLDILPTALAAAGCAPAASAGSQARQLDGVDLRPALSGNAAAPPHETLFWRFRFPSPDPAAQKFAIRQGRWKLVRDGGPPALYDLVADLGEKTDLAAREPERAAALLAEWNEWNATLEEPRWSVQPRPAKKKAAAAARGELRIVNGDFADITGLTRSTSGWLGGVPEGWTAAGGAYAVHETAGTAAPTGNVQGLGLLRQQVGTTAAAGDVELSFSVSAPWKPDVALEAALVDEAFRPFAFGRYESGERHVLVAKGVPAGTPLTAVFQAAASAPALDDVAIRFTPAAPITGAAAPRPPANDDVFVACYYFGNYHPDDARNERQKGKGWSEWELVKQARPRFAGHVQPRVPLWGHTDESQPAEMARKIDAAADHGLDAFIFDWYYYDDGPFLEQPIDDGFLQAKNNGRLKFAFMWANHDWIDIHPARHGGQHPLLYPGKVTPETFAKIGDLLVSRYFAHPSYWRIDGKPYFSVYDLQKLVESFGSVAATRAALDGLRAKAVAAGLPGVHVNAVVWGRPILPGEQAAADPATLVKDLGFDSVTSYVWIHHVPLPKQETDYDIVRDGYLWYWGEAERRFSVPFFPNVTMGWDSSPRAHQSDAFDNSGYPFMNTISGNTPARFQRALALTKRRLLADPAGPRVVTINCWNEWTEGSYLEPDTVHGTAYLEAVRTVFGSQAGVAGTPRR